MKTYAPKASIPLQFRFPDDTSGLDDYISFAAYSANAPLSAIADGKVTFTVKKSGSAVSTTIEGVTTALTDMTCNRHPTDTDVACYTIAEGLTDDGLYTVNAWYAKDNGSGVRTHQILAYGEFRVKANAVSTNPPTTS
jgi:predicted ThiF/HesA family dinucleotide-utilizing enzyme